jgi:hypothetical protein
MFGRTPRSLGHGRELHRMLHCDESMSLSINERPTRPRAALHRRRTPSFARRRRRAPPVTQVLHTGRQHSERTPTRLSVAAGQGPGPVHVDRAPLAVHSSVRPPPASCPGSTPASGGAAQDKVEVRVAVRAYVARLLPRRDHKAVPQGGTARGASSPRARSRRGCSWGACSRRAPSAWPRWSAEGCGGRRATAGAGTTSELERHRARPESRGTQG